MEIYALTSLLLLALVLLPHQPRGAYSSRRRRRQADTPGRFHYPSSGSALFSPCVLLSSDITGSCRPINDCPFVLRTFRATTPTICGWLNRDPLVCCPGPSLATTDVCAVSSSRTRRQVNRLPFANTPRPPTHKIEEEVTVLPRPEVVGGTLSAEDSRPWMVAILTTEDEGSIESRLLCGGTLIGTHHVLTAAHCFPNSSPNPSNYEVVMGATNLSDSKAVLASIASILVHPEFKLPALYNDVTLIQLENAVTFNRHVRPACLPSPGYRNVRFTNSEALVSGWGRTSFAGSTSEVLLEVTFPVVPNSECDTIYRGLLGRKQKTVYADGITDSLLCAGHAEERKDSCSGDSGGPLVFADPASKRWMLIGVVSSGYRCAVPGVPGIYTRVTAYLDWIQNNVK